MIEKLIKKVVKTIEIEESLVYSPNWRPTPASVAKVLRDIESGNNIDFEWTEGKRYDIGYDWILSVEKVQLDYITEEYGAVFGFYNSCGSIDNKVYFSAPGYVSSFSGRYLEHGNIRQVAPKTMTMTIWD